MFRYRLSFQLAILFIIVVFLLVFSLLVVAIFSPLLRQIVLPAIIFAAIFNFPATIFFASRPPATVVGWNVGDLKVLKFLTIVRQYTWKHAPFEQEV